MLYYIIIIFTVNAWNICESSIDPMCTLNRNQDQHVIDDTEETTNSMKRIPATDAGEIGIIYEDDDEANDGHENEEHNALHFEHDDDGRIEGIKKVYGGQDTMAFDDHVEVQNEAEDQEQSPEVK